MQDFFENNHLKFNHLISFFKVLVRNMKKGKAYTPDEIFSYVNNQIEKYSEKNDVVFFCDIADIFNRINKKHAIDFLETKMNPPETDASKNIGYLHPMIALSSYYKDAGKAFELKERIFSLFSSKVKQLDFKGRYSSLYSLILFLSNKNEYGDQEKIKIIDENLMGYIEANDLKTIKKIAELYGLVDVSYRIDYLKRKTGKTDDNFNLLLELSDMYLKNNDFENAFKELQRANQLINQRVGQFDYLWNLKTIYEKSAEICIKDKNPHYSEYLIYYLQAFALDIIRDLTGFPTIPGFYYRKKIQYSPYEYNAYDNLEIDTDEDDEMDIALKNLNLFKNRKEMFEEYNKFIYDELPRIYGIPPEYDEYAVHKIFDKPTTHPDAWRKLMDFSQEITNKDISYIYVEIINFVTKLIEKYYNMGK